MEYGILKFIHVLGAVLMGGGLIGVWMADLRSRQLSELKRFSEAVRNIAVLLRRTCGTGRPVAARLRHLDDCEVLWRLELRADPLAGRDGRLVCLRVHRR